MKVIGWLIWRQHRHRRSTTRPFCRSFARRIQDQSRFSFRSYVIYFSQHARDFVVPPQVPASRLEPYACVMVQWLLFAHEGTLLTWENALINFFALVLSGHVGFVQWKWLFWHGVSKLCSKTNGIHHSARYLVMDARKTFSKHLRS